MAVGSLLPQSGVLIVNFVKGDGFEFDSVDFTFIDVAHFPET
jgi:hypothetical protein